jgi:hypothetical protein
MQLTRKQLKEAVKTMPIDSVLGVSGELTHKQKEFARLVASGETGAGAYRKAYNSKGKPQTVGKHASNLRKDDRIKTQIEAFERAKAATAYHVPQHLRALIVNSLVEVVTDPEAKASTKVAAAKVLGTVAGVDAFVTRSEHRVIKSSEDAKGALLAKLREVMNTGATDAVMVDADSLVRELTHDATATDANAAPEVDPAVSDSAGDAAETPTTPNGVRSPSISIHTNEHTESSPNPNQDPPPSDSVTSLEDELSGNTPLGKTE